MSFVQRHSSVKRLSFTVSDLKLFDAAEHAAPLMTMSLHGRFVLETLGYVGCN